MINTKIVTNRLLITDEISPYIKTVKVVLYTKWLLIFFSQVQN